MSRIAFNGYLFSQRQTGTMRYAREILIKLDQIVQQDEFSLVVPEYAEHVPDLKTIKIVKYGKTKGNLWEQTDYCRYLRKTHQGGFGFNNTFPICRPGMLVIHDIAYKLHPEFGVSIHGKLSNLYHRLIFSIAAKGTFPIVTVSYFSKYQLIDWYHIAPERITVIGSAWQHFDRISEDTGVLTELGISERGYYFTLGSLSIMKNTKWVIEAARKNPAEKFVIAGGKAMAGQMSFSTPPNVVFTGYISDERIKTLMRSCKAFIYPSVYDGFGLPPLEALSQGAEVICSNAACLPEVYGNSVHYIDPYDSDVDLDELLKQYVAPPEAVLNKYNWEKSAELLYAILRKELKEHGCP